MESGRCFDEARRAEQNDGAPHDASAAKNRTAICRQSVSFAWVQKTSSGVLGQATTPAQMCPTILQFQENAFGDIAKTLLSLLDGFFS
jgi:hypothetical protein